MNQLKSLLKRNIFILKHTKLDLIIIYASVFLCAFPIWTSSTIKENTTYTYDSLNATDIVDLKTIFSYKAINFPQNSIIGFVLPNNNTNEDIINKVMKNELITSFGNIKPMTFKNIDEVNNYSNNYHNTILASIHFESDDYLKYTICTNSTYTPSPTLNPITDYGLGRKNFKENGMMDADNYMNIFTPIQAAVDQAIIQTNTNDDTFIMKHQVGRMVKPEITYKSKSNFEFINKIILIHTCSILFMMVIGEIINLFVEEKERGIKAGLLMNGVHPLLNYLSWLIIFVFIILTLNFIILPIFYFAKTFECCNFIIIFLSFFFYGVSNCLIGIMVNPLLKNLKIADAAFGFIIIGILGFSVLSFKMCTSIKKLLSIFISPVAISSFVIETFTMEENSQNLSFNNIFFNSCGYYLAMLIVNNIIYFCLFIVFDNIFSGETSRYLFFNKSSIGKKYKVEEISYQQDIQEDFNAAKGARCVVEVSHVYKIFNNGLSKEKDQENVDKSEKSNRIKDDKFLAVNDVNFKVYENEIFAILGHNGAGKTTLINIMVGLLKATQGDIYFDGKSIATHTNEIRKNFGVCSQSNNIYEDLTVEENIKFYADLKRVKIDIDSFLSEIDILSEKFTQAKKLSGGQKRKLCIGIAIIGNPKYVFLDEPTTGLDPLSRRRVWNLLSKKKEGRVIFITTHYMDEADILADRKLILNKGKIRCLGTSLYLKNHFNMNYHLNVETESKQKVNDIVQQYIPDAIYVESNIENEHSNFNENVHTWLLPLNTTEQFSNLLDELERQSEENEETESINTNLGKKKNKLIKKFGLFMPSLEELFINLEDETFNGNYGNSIHNKKENNNKEIQHLIQINENQLPKLKLITQPSRFTILKNLIKYRLKIFLKDKAFAFTSIILPIIIAGSFFLIINHYMLNEKNTSSESSVISVLEMYNETYLNLEPNQSLDITVEDIANANYKQEDRVKGYELSNIPNSETSGHYYLASIGGQTIQNYYNFSIHYNDTMTHAIPATFNAISNSILFSRNITNPIVVKSELFNKSSDILVILGLSIAGLLIGLCISTNIVKFGSLMVRERVDQLLLQLQLNGVSRINYWLSCLLSDNLIFLFTCSSILIIGVIVQFKPLMYVKILGIIFIVLVFWSIPAILYQYILSFSFKKASSSNNVFFIINCLPILIGYMIFTYVNMYRISSIDIENQKFFSNIAIASNVGITMLCPTFGFVAIIHSMFTLKMYEQLLNYEFSIKNLIKIGNGISPVALVLLIQIVIFFILLIKLDASKNGSNTKNIEILSEKEINKRKEGLADGDDDVYNEYQYVKDHQKELPLSILHLSKEYKTQSGSSKEKSKIAVADISFGVRNHECFGLLGPNGAGKSTTLNILTSVIPQTTGEIYFNGINPRDSGIGRKSIGYCSQKDILWNELTLREHLEFFLSLRGYNNRESKEYATQYIHYLGLEEHQHKQTEKLSGGTKRKLSLLIAICGYPKQILLDEPTAGMDPSTRRMTWNLIQQTKNINKTSIIMTTHSMEEAEILCDRLAVITNGRLKCIGSPEHLKMKFGKEYILEVHSKDIERFHQEVIEYQHLFEDKEYTMELSSINTCKYNVNMTRQLGQVFNIMEQCKCNGLVYDYSFNQTSLEQIFINFAKDQTE